MRIVDVRETAIPLNSSLANSSFDFSEMTTSVVAVITEFGRTVAENGTGGTDHRTAGAAFLLGGAVQGGKVVTRWPGLSASALYEGRDLAPTLDLRSVLKGVLAEHLNLSPREIDSTVFPDSASAAPLRDLARV